jgi:hypothetical protein
MQKTTSLPSSTVKEKTTKDDDESRGLLSSFVVKGKKNKDNDELGSQLIVVISTKE